MKILIIEDEERSFMRLRRLLLNMDERLEIEGPVTSVQETIKTMCDSSTKYDIIFADIRLDDGDVFEAFLQTQPEAPVIFTTAYNEYALEAFRSNGIAYLQKPIIAQELSEAMYKAKRLVTSTTTPQDLSALLSSLGLKQAYREHFLVQKTDGYMVINVADINHFFTENGITRAFLNNGHSVMLDYSLGDIEGQLEPNKFLRVSRQYIICIDSIEQIHFSYNYKLSVKLKGYPQTLVIVSKDKSVQLREWIDR